MNLRYKGKRCGFQSNCMHTHYILYLQEAWLVDVTNYQTAYIKVDFFFFKSLKQYTFLSTDEFHCLYNIAGWSC